MITKKFAVQNRLGIHARPAAMFAKEANRHECEIRVEKDGLDVNGKSIMGIMMLAAAQGNVIKVLADGADEKKAIAALGRLIRNKFGEE